MIKFDCTKEENLAIGRIVTRALSLFEDADPSMRQGLLMDLSACHSNGCPLDFERLEQADDFNLMHDVGGIHRHINRRTGKLENCFLPRCAKPESEVVAA